LIESAPAQVLERLYSGFVTLRRAVSNNDLEAIEASTAGLRACLEQLPGPADLSAQQRALIVEVETLSADVADMLASRLRAIDMTIGAWRKAQEDP
jgi:hypothetical protein